jgi:DNA modification methylase
MKGNERFMLQEIEIADIKVGSRHRHDMGDLAGLADSIRQEGLLQPIGVTDRLELVFGERRLRASRDVLKKETILARIVDVTSILNGKYAENEIRKDFTPSERVAIAKAVEKQVGNRRGQRTDKQPVQNFAQVGAGRKTRDVAAEKAGFGNHETYRQASKVVENGTPTLIRAMDAGRVSISAAAILADAHPDEQDSILELDEKAILRAAKEIRARQAERRAEDQDSKTVKPQIRPSKERLQATRLIHGDCRKEMKKLPDESIDLILSDPPYPEIERQYGRMTESEWHGMMRDVVTEGRRVLKPGGSMVIVLQPNYETVGKMRLWAWEFLIWAAREWKLIQDVYWWAYDSLPLSGTKRHQGLLRSSVKTCVWLGPADCFRNQDNVLWLPADVNFAESRADRSQRRGPSGRSYSHGDMAETVEERDGSTPFNLLPVATGGTSADVNSHPSKIPYEVAAWWAKYLLPQGGVLLDCFAGSGTMLAAGLEFGASQVIGIEREKKYLDIAKKRIAEG